MRWHDVIAEFHDFAITTFDVDPDALRRLVPAPLQPDVFVLRDGRARAFVSAVSFRARNVRSCLVPWPRLGHAQVNYRAYVVGPGGRGVWFFMMAMDNAWAALPQALLGLPCRRARVALEAQWDGERCRRYAMRQTGFASAQLEAEAVGVRPTAAPDGFASWEEACQVLTHPLVGHSRRRGGVSRYTVEHAPLTPMLAAAGAARFSLFEDLGLVTAEARPHSVLIQRRTEFGVHIPPR